MFFTIFRYWNCSSRSCEKSKLIGNNSWNCGVWMKSQGNAKYEKRIYYAAFSKIRNMQSFSQQKAFFSYFRKYALYFLYSSITGFGAFCVTQLGIFSEEREGPLKRPHVPWSSRETPPPRNLATLILKCQKVKVVGTSTFQCFNRWVFVLYVSSWQ